jgi:RHS repeat-associated protein
MGSVRSVSNGYGGIEERYEYDVFGTPFRGDFTQGMNLGYTGKPYDTSTGLYDYGYRDYSPALARFTTADPIRDGSNWFAYVNNDPVNWVDLWGLLPGDVFATMDDAANDFGSLYNVDSIINNKEYGASIYVKDGGYTYTVPSRGTTASVIMSVPKTAIPVAYLHTHAAYDSKYINNDFSNTDKLVAKISGIPFYLASPNGFLQVYDPIADVPALINHNMPSDKNDPLRENSNHPSSATYNANPTINGFQNFVDHIINFMYSIFVDPIKNLFSHEQKKNK